MKLSSFFLFLFFCILFVKAEVFTENNKYLPTGFWSPNDIQNHDINVIKPHLRSHSSIESEYENNYQKASNSADVQKPIKDLHLDERLNISLVSFNFSTFHLDCLNNYYQNI